MPTMTIPRFPFLINQVDQDVGGVQGWLVSLSNTTAGLTQVWMRPLSDGTTAVAMVNAGSVPQYMAVSLA